MSLKFPVSLVGKRTPAEYMQPTDTFVYDANDNILDSINGDIPNEWKRSDPNVFKVEIGSSCSLIGIDAFRGIPNLTIRYPEGDNNFTLPENVTDVNYRGFQGCGYIGTLFIPHLNSPRLRSGAFRYSAFSRIEFGGNRVGAIESGTFLNLSNIDGFIHVPINAVGFAASYDGLTVVYDLPAI